MNRKICTFLTAGLLIASLPFGRAGAQDSTGPVNLLDSLTSHTDSLVTLQENTSYVINLTEDVVLNTADYTTQPPRKWMGFKKATDKKGTKLTIKGTPKADGTNPVVTGGLCIAVDTLEIEGVTFSWTAADIKKYGLAGPVRLLCCLASAGYIKNCNFVGPYEDGIDQPKDSLSWAIEMYPLNDAKPGAIEISGNHFKNIRSSAPFAINLGVIENKDSSPSTWAQGYDLAHAWTSPDPQIVVAPEPSNTFENTPFKYMAWDCNGGKAAGDVQAQDVWVDAVDPEDLINGTDSTAYKSYLENLQWSLESAGKWNTQHPEDKATVDWNGSNEQLNEWMKDLDITVAVDVETNDGPATVKNKDKMLPLEFNFSPDTFYYSIDTMVRESEVAPILADVLPTPQTIEYADSTLVLVDKPDADHFYLVAVHSNKDTLYSINGWSAYVDSLQPKDATKRPSLDTLFTLKDGRYLKADTGLWKAERKAFDDEHVYYTFTNNYGKADSMRLKIDGATKNGLLVYRDYDLNGTEGSVKIGSDGKVTSSGMSATDTMNIGFYKLNKVDLNNLQVDLLTGGGHDGFRVNVTAENGNIEEGDVFSNHTLIPINTSADDTTKTFYLAYGEKNEETGEMDTTQYIVLKYDDNGGPYEDGGGSNPKLNKYIFDTIPAATFNPTKHKGEFKVKYDPRGAHPMYVTNPKYYQLDELYVSINGDWAKVGYTTFNGKDVLLASVGDTQKDVTFGKTDFPVETPEPTPPTDRISASELLNGGYYNVEFVNTTDKVDDNGQVDKNQTYKKDGLLTVIEGKFGAKADYFKVHADSVALRKAYLSYPDAQWVVKRVELAGDTEDDENHVVDVAGGTTIKKGLVTLVNRENPDVTVDSLYLYRTDKVGEYLVHGFNDGGFNNDSVYNEVYPNVIAGDLLRFTPVEVDPFDGFKHVEDPNALIDTVYTIAVLNNPVNEITNAYWVEKHPSETHQIGLDGNVKEATNWNLHVLTKDVNGEVVSDYALVRDTVWYIDEDYTITSDLDTLYIQQYAIQNDDNNEFVKYNDAKGFEYYICDPENKNFEELPTNPTEKKDFYFALKQRPNGAYHIVSLYENDGLDWTGANHMRMGDKLFGLRDQNQGSVKKMANYKDDGNSLMLIEPVGMPEYRRFADVATEQLGLDTIKIFSDYDPADVLYEKKDSLNDLSIIQGSDPVDYYSFLNDGNEVQFSTQQKDFNPALFVDTAYVDRPGNNRWQYLLAVDVKLPDDNVLGYHWECDNPEHNKPEWLEENGIPDENGVLHCEHAKKVEDPVISYVEGRYLVNLIDTANAYAKQPQMHGNPFINEKEAGNGGVKKAKLAFVWARHFTDDNKLAFYKGPQDWTWEAIPEDATVWGDTLDLNTPDLKIATFAFRYEDVDAQSFKIQTQYKPYEPLDPDKVKTGTNNNGYIRLENGTVVVDEGLEQGNVFNLEPLEGVTPTENESITAGGVVVAGVDGAVVVKGAEGKTVVVTTILGKVVANKVLTSDNATVAAPAGIVVVSVDGESYKVVVR